jgi:hypothetical protein
VGKNLKGNGLDIIEVLSRNLTLGTEENQESPKCKSRTLPLDEPAV